MVDIPHSDCGATKACKFESYRGYIAGGSKGDFIFRDYEDGTEYISIMFEMKNTVSLTCRTSILRCT